MRVGADRIALEAASLGMATARVHVELREAHAPPAWRVEARSAERGSPGSSDVGQCCRRWETPTKVQATHTHGVLDRRRPTHEAAQPKCLGITGEGDPSPSGTVHSRPPVAEDMQAGAPS